MCKLRGLSASIHAGTGARRTLSVGSRSYDYYPLDAAGEVAKLRVVLQNLVRHDDSSEDSAGDIAAFAEWVANGGEVDA